LKQLLSTLKRLLRHFDASLLRGGEKMQLDPSKNAMQKNAKKMQKNATSKEIPL
jgi:hypothetical protein